jgi:hypothetical protein
VGKGLEKVGKGCEAKVMLRGSLSNHHFNFSHLLTHYYKFYILPCLDFSNQNCCFRLTDTLGGQTHG